MILTRKCRSLIPKGMLRSRVGVQSAASRFIRVSLRDIEPPGTSLTRQRRSSSTSFSYSCHCYSSGPCCFSNNIIIVFNNIDDRGADHIRSTPAFIARLTRSLLSEPQHRCGRAPQPHKHLRSPFGNTHHTLLQHLRSTTDPLPWCSRGCAAVWGRRRSASPTARNAEHTPDLGERDGGGQCAAALCRRNHSRVSVLVFALVLGLG